MNFFKPATFLNQTKIVKRLRLRYILKGANSYLGHSYRGMSRNKNSYRGISGNSRNAQKTDLMHMHSSASMHALGRSKKVPWIYKISPVLAAAKAA